MTDPADPKGRAPQSDSEHARVLSEVLEDQKRREEARAKTDRPPPGSGSDTSFFLQVGLLVSGTLFFYLLFFSPTWIAPDPAPAIAVERQEDNLRFYLFMIAKQVDAFRTTEGRLPDTVEEIPGVKPGTEYVRLSSRDYRIRFTAGEVTVTYESNQDPDTFLGDAENAVLGGGARGAGGAP